MAKRLVIFVEGIGDVKAVPVLARRIINEISAGDALFVDGDPFRIRSLAKLVKNNCSEWRRWIDIAGRTRSHVGAILLVLDGDIDPVPAKWTTYSERFKTEEFCAFRVAATLGEEGRAVRAGEAFSLASAFAMKEFEAWLLAGVESLRGTPMAFGRGIVPNDAACISDNIEEVRDAKGRLQKIVPHYNQSLDQGILAEKVSLELVGQRCRSFRRFRSAIQQLADANRSGRHIVTPVGPG